MKKLLHSRNTGLVIVLILLLVMARILTPNMFSVQAIINMLQNNSVYALLAVGEMVVILTSGIDISIASLLAFVGSVTTSLSCSNPGLPGVTWFILAIVLGALCGALNGALVGYLHMVPMICTLGTMYIFRGLAFAVSGGQWWFAASYLDSYRVFAIAKILGIPAIVWIAVIVMVLVGLFLGYTAPGRRIYAIGTSRESSAVAGIKEPTVTFYAYIICGVLAGLAGMLYTANYAGGYYGIGILSKYPMIDIEKMLLPNPEKKEQRGLIVGNFEMEQDTITFACTHLEVSSEKTRLQQVDFINNYFKNAKYQTILGGDFNTQPSQKPIVEMRKVWGNVTNDDLTYPSWAPRTKIDYLFTLPQKGWKVIRTQAVHSVLSDHLPIVTEMEYIR